MKFLRTQLILLAATLLMLELVLQVAYFFSLDMRRLVASPWQPTAIPDQRLVVRGNPLHREADAAGYRNASRPARADVVALGDSHTYGPELREDSWPSVLSRLRQQTVYNMALHGYGPLQSYLQLDEALSLKPKLVIVAPYFGNDFYDTFLLFQRHKPELKNWVSPELLEQATAAERERPFEAEVTEFYRFGGPRPGRTDAVVPAHRWISDNIRLYGLVRALKYRLQPEPVTPLLSRNLATAARSLTPAMKRYTSIVDEPNRRTILTAPYRNLVIDDRDPRIRLGFEVSREATIRMAQRCREAGVEFVVLLIPTKEMVFSTHVKVPKEHPRLEELIANETRLRREWIQALQARSIRYVDALDALARATRQPYPEDLDGHPTEVGHRALALELQRFLAAGAARP